ncbi:MAG: response regulator [Rhodothalassiaceae bacterium]
MLLPSRTVLIADDEPTIARLYGGLLVQNGFDVLLASDGREAFDRAYAERPALALLDVNMPHMSGLEVIQALAVAEARSGPVLLMTGDDRAGTVQAGLAAGADDFLVKGQGAEDLIQAVRLWLGMGFARLPDLVRARLVNGEIDPAAPTGLMRLARIDETVVADVATTAKADMAALPEDFGRRRIDRMLLVARLSRLLIDRINGDLTLGVRFVYLLVATLNRLDQAWVRDAHHLFARFDELCADERFQAAYQHGLAAALPPR